jgi:hypothetical protein
MKASILEVSLLSRAGEIVIAGLENIFVPSR